MQDFQPKNPQSALFSVLVMSRTSHRGGHVVNKGTLELFASWRSMLPRWNVQKLAIGLHNHRCWVGQVIALPNGVLLWVSHTCVHVCTDICIHMCMDLAARTHSPSTHMHVHFICIAFCGVMPRAQQNVNGTTIVVEVLQYLTRSRQHLHGIVAFAA